MKKLFLILLLAFVSKSSFAFCFKEAADRYRVDEWLLVAIAKTESKLDPNATHRNADGSVDYGLMQVNDSWLPKLRRFGIDEKRLKDPCINVNVGAWILAENFIQHGRTWKAVGAYNAKSAAKRAAYAQRVWKNAVVAQPVPARGAVVKLASAGN